VFGEEGLSAPMREAARHAGVGPATLYRRFPTKRTLIAETFAEQRRACHAAVRDALADSGPWRGFRSLIERHGEASTPSGLAATSRAACAVSPAP
jgi:AcrR family transcriptional regulator